MHGMEYEVAQEQLRRRLEEAELYRLQAQARRSASTRRSLDRLVFVAGFVATVALTVLVLFV